MHSLDSRASKSNKRRDWFSVFTQMLFDVEDGKDSCHRDPNSVNSHGLS